MANSKNKPSVLEDKRYHNTWKLLSHYRDVVWSMEVSVEELRNEFKLEYKTNIDDFLESIYMAGADLSGTQVERHARTISRPTYFRIHRKAVDAVSPILWGYSSRECISILDEFFPEGSQT